MRGLVLSFLLLALLAAIAASAVFIGPRLPEPIRAEDGSGLILFGLAVYVACAIGLVLAIVQTKRTKAAINSPHRLTFFASALALLSYVFWVSALIIAVMQSTDL